MNEKLLKLRFKPFLKTILDLKNYKNNSLLQKKNSLLQKKNSLLQK